MPTTPHHATVPSSPPVALVLTTGGTTCAPLLLDVCHRSPSISFESPTGGSPGFELPTSPEPEIPKFRFNSSLSLSSAIKNPGFSGFYPSDPFGPHPTAPAMVALWYWSIVNLVSLLVSPGELPARTVMIWCPAARARLPPAQPSPHSLRRRFQIWQRRQPERVVLLLFARMVTL